MGKIIDARGFLVYKDNHLIQKIIKHKRQLTAKEQKIIAYLLSKINPNDKYDKNKSYYVTLNKKEFCEICGVAENNSGNTEYIIQALLTLSGHGFTMDTGEGVLGFQWITEPYIKRGENEIEIQIPNRTYKYLVELKNFTKYELYKILPLKSTYSIALYEYIKSYSYKSDEIIVSINDLKYYLGVITDETENNGEQKYKSFIDFKKRVLNIAINEINKYTDITIEWQGIREGHTYKWIKFIISDKDTKQRFEAYQATQQALDG